jgi:hypothetical protein
MDLSEADRRRADGRRLPRARQAAVCHCRGILSMGRYGRQAVIPEAVVAELGSDAGRGTGRLTRTVPPQANALRCRSSKLLGRAGPVPRGKIGSRDKSGIDGNLQPLVESNANRSIYKSCPRFTRSLHSVTAIIQHFTNRSGPYIKRLQRLFRVHPTSQAQLELELKGDGSDDGYRAPSRT